MTLSSTKLLRTLAASIALFALAGANHAQAFCGFYVTGADSTLYANATMVVMMRDGTRTVLSIQNNYQGPPESFALVVPVPVVLQKENVKVLEKDVFKRVDTLGAPRLVEYWETDPCRPQYEDRVLSGGLPTAPVAQSAAGNSAVKIEAQFAVGEYDVVVLSANDSSALDTWLRDNKYNIPSGAGPVLAPYVAAGMKFFVAKVDTTRVTFQGNQAALSPLRFHYDTQEFSLPVRLGLLNSQGSQDLIVNILAAQRYEVANYPNVTVPTNIRVQDDVRNAFADFYEALFARTLEKNPKAVVTEYSWASSSCDPCPTAPLSQQDVMTLGGDVLQPDPQQKPQPGGPAVISPNLYGFSLTRLHARYTKDMLGEDLVFQQAPAIVGGRGVPGRDGMLDQSVMQTPNSTFNNFQGRYVILHAWDKPVTCQNPMRGFWGGPSGAPGTQPMTQAPTNGALMGMTPKAADLPALLAESVPSLSITALNPLDPLAPAAAGSGAKTPAAGSGTATAGASAVVPPPNHNTPDVPVEGNNWPPSPASGGSSASTSEPSAPAKKTSHGCSVGQGEGSAPFALTAFGVAFALLARRRRTTRSLG